MSKRKFTRDQARTALLVAGREMLAEVGLSGGVGRVTLAEAINRSGVPRPSAYRVFGETDLDPQRSFHEELIIDITQVGPQLEMDAIEDPVRLIMTEVDQIGVEASPEDLTWYLRELIRVAGISATDATFTETPIGVYLSVLSSTLDAERNDRIEAAARHAEQIVVEAFTPFLREALASFGLRLRAGWAIDDLSRALIAAILGGLLTARISAGASSLSLRTGRNGEPQEWAPLGVSFLGLVGLACEADPRMVSSAQPARWFG